MLKLKSALRIKRRYLLLSAKSEKEVKDVILDYIGILGFSKAAPLFITNKGNLILAIDRNSLNDIRAAFEVAETKIKVLKVSGTLKGLS